MREQILGYFLMSIGIVIMGISVYQVFQIFTNQTLPVMIFKDEAPTASSINPIEALTNTEELTKMQTQLLSQMFDKQLNKSMNLAASSFVMYFVMLFGFRLASLGVMLVRPIVVKVKGKEEM